MKTSTQLIFSIHANFLSFFASLIKSSPLKWKQTFPFQSQPLF